MRIFFLDGPNLNLLGEREPEIYGKQSLKAIQQAVREEAAKEQVEVAFFQSNSEGELMDKMQEEFPRASAFVLNPAALTHTSLALADCVRASPVPVVEVHLSNIYGREPIRQKSLTAPYVRGIIAGFGPLSYLLGFRAALLLARQ